MAKPYSTEADVRTQAPFKDDTLITDAYITQKIAEADDLIDSMIGQVYQLPLSSNPDTIVYLSKAITTCFLYREQNTNFEVEPGVSIEDFKDNLIQTLEMIRTRKIKLFDSSGAELALTGITSPQFFPTDASSDPSAENTTAPKLTMNQKF